MGPPTGAYWYVSHPLSSSTILIALRSTYNPYVNTTKQQEDIMELLIILIAFILFAIAAKLWGADSRDGIDSTEWERRRNAAKLRWLPTHHL
jgi:hypothetical protein